MVKKYNKANNMWDVMGRLPVRADMQMDGVSPSRLVVVSFWLLVGREALKAKLSSLALGLQSQVQNGMMKWKVLGVKENGGVLVYNCAVKGC